jgi:hypothetical protein
MERITAARVVLDAYAPDRPLAEVLQAAVEFLRAGAAASEWVHINFMTLGGAVFSALGVEEFGCVTANPQPTAASSRSWEPIEGHFLRHFWAANILTMGTVALGKDQEATENAASSAALNRPVAAAAAAFWAAPPVAARLAARLA